MMSGLIYKEVCMFKSQFKNWIYGILILGVYGIVFKTLSMLFMLVALVGVMSCITTFTYDRQYRCDEYVAAMPVSRKKIVVSKYIFLLLVDLMMTVVTIILVVAVAPFLKENILSALGAVMGVLAVTILLQILVLPLLYAWGPEKARFAFLIIGILPYMLVMLNKDRLPDITPQTVLHILQASPFILAVAAGISLLVSIGLYKKKDL